ncbi:ribonuclease P protein component [Anatilimnocola floriformis]|uniref:ribonuclease P protein component n=1 Tax=Anatilimnocola floriformis TaxID=2948575 RepID=UPI0020C22CAB|nr:ribonuclease P protein component [Anatilimnocola floriformis]
MADASFPKVFHLLKQAEFDRVFATRAYAADDHLIIHGCANELPISRLGLSVSKKSGNSPQRNYWKRSIREAFRLNREQMPRGIDIVVRPQKGAKADSLAIQQSLPVLVQKLAKRLKLPSRPTEESA